MTEAEQPVLVNTQESSVSSGSDSEIKGNWPFDPLLGRRNSIFTILSTALGSSCWQSSCVSLSINVDYCISLGIHKRPFVNKLHFSCHINAVSSDLNGYLNGYLYGYYGP